MASDKILEITDDNFEQVVLQSDVPVLVDLWAPWCGPCRQIAPVMEQLAEKYEGRIKVGKINVDDNRQVAVRLGISSIPAVFLFRDGNRVAERIGALPRSFYEEMVEQHL